MYRGVEQSGQLAWLITTRSEVQILSPQPRKTSKVLRSLFCLVILCKVLSFSEALQGDGHQVEVVEGADHNFSGDSLLLFIGLPQEYLF